VNCRRRLSPQELKALGARPGLVITRYAPDGERATIRQLAPEGFDRKRDFIRRLTSPDDDTQTNEGRKTA
jgi:hypothetical protein